ncbi:NAD(P)H-dependent oxidoreductase [uncultured Flavobacterium sp.]|uniref:NAD(P)H-dependent oxidoreductase n=1 Tax=uncultured Flavobacterium sp. TaxID=165435 RepID=UPI0025F0F5D7|nr:NAD(P)H-dependent oxidoreductase [uncultured Flavobacterium sp.]
MENTLIILAHPNFSLSKSNRLLLESLPEGSNVTIHNIFQSYPDLKIDIAKEQELLSKYDKIIFQFPTFWFNIPGFLKIWIDEVFTYGWAYGPDGTALNGKKIGIATTTGGEKSAYSREGIRGFSVEDFLTPVIGSIKYVGADYIGYVALNNTYALDEKEVKEAKEAYFKLVLQ